MCAEIVDTMLRERGSERLLTYARNVFAHRAIDTRRVIPSGAGRHEGKGPVSLRYAANQRGAGTGRSAGHVLAAVSSMNTSRVEKAAAVATSIDVPGHDRAIQLRGAQAEADVWR